MRLSAGVEALGALDPDIRAHLLGSQWPKMRGMRNRIAHDYGFIDDAIRPTDSLSQSATGRRGSPHLERDLTRDLMH